jgi:putative transposase
MTTGYKIDHPGRLYFCTFTVVDWVDVFTRKIYNDIVLDSFTYCRTFKELQIWAYVIMSNHVHCILSAKKQNLPDIIRDFKRHTASKILNAIQSYEESRRDWMMKRFEFAARSNVRNSPHQFWQHDNHAEELNTLKFTAQKLDYIHLNPVRAGLVEKPEDWLYSSARNYMFLPSLMEIDLMDINY